MVFNLIKKYNFEKLFKIYSTQKNISKLVQVPTGFPYTPPFNIYNTNNTFSISEDFDLEEYANITVSKTYYVSTSGSNSNDGLTIETAFRDIWFAITRADIDQVLIEAGLYSYDHSWQWHTPNRNMKIKAIGGSVFFSNNIDGLVWTSTSNYYSASFSASFDIGNVVDFSTLDAFGDGIPLVYVTSIAEVNNTTNSWFYDNVSEILYVRTFDDREPDNDIRSYSHTVNCQMNDSVTWYFEGITFDGGLNNLLITNTSSGSRGYFKNCTFRYCSSIVNSDNFLSRGGTEVICMDCVSSYASNDGYKMIQNADQQPSFIMINCVGRNNGKVGVASANGYSRHGGGSTIAINSQFFSNVGRNVHDIFEDTYVWMLGVTCYDSSYGVNFAVSDSAIMWLDGCISEDAFEGDISPVNVDSVINYRNMNPANPTSIGSGTIQTY